jgi:hypothetical protein
MLMTKEVPISLPMDAVDDDASEIVAVSVWKRLLDRLPMTLLMTKMWSREMTKIREKMERKLVRTSIETFQLGKTP